MRRAVMRATVSRFQAMHRCAATLAVTAGTILLPAAAVIPARAQVAVENPPLSATYAAGVHAFFSGDLARSHETLTAVIEAGTRDPRAWYFRGLAALRMGRLDEAESDFTEGAARETAATGGWPVSRSLERVQGAERLQLERHRSRARVAALERDREARQRRYVEIEQAAPEVLRSRRPTPAPVRPGDVFGGRGAGAEPLDLPTPREPATETDLGDPPMQLEAEGLDLPAEAPLPSGVVDPFAE